METKKKKVLFVGWESFQHIPLHENPPFKAIREKYDVTFVEHLTDALKEVAKALYEHHNPVKGLVFNRKFLVNHSKECRILYDFAELWNERSMICSITLLKYDFDAEARDVSPAPHFALDYDWSQVLVILDHN